MAEVSEDWNTNLATYQAQLQQVEAALTNEPENEELIKLKADLQDVIELTLDLIQAGPGSKSEAAADDEEADTESTSAWSVGDSCQAIYSQDGLYYEGTIDEVHDDGTVTVTFEGYGNTDTVQISKLKPSETTKGTKRQSDEAGNSSDKPLSKKQLLAKQREYKKRKTQKKIDRQKQMEQKHEEQKNSWLNFSSKASKGKKGMTKKSIFASPESSTGKVGIGTCGVGGAPMTKFDRPKHNVVRK